MTPIGSSVAGRVLSVFGRTGNVAAQAGDYTAAQVTNAADKASASPQVFAGGFRSANANLSIGYAIGGGGVVTQITSRATAVTLNRPSGVIATTTGALGAGATATFVVNNSTVDALSTVVLSMTTASGVDSILYNVYAVGSGVFSISYLNNTAASFSFAVQFNFAVIHAINQ